MDISKAYKYSLFRNTMMLPFYLFAWKMTDSYRTHRIIKDFF